MPLITVIAPESPVVVEGMELPGAVVERVELRSGVNPLVYHLAYRTEPRGPVRRASFRGDRVTEPETPAGGFVLPSSNRLEDLGRAMAEGMGPDA